MKCLAYPMLWMVGVAGCTFDTSGLASLSDALLRDLADASPGDEDGPATAQDGAIRADAAPSYGDEPPLDLSVFTGSEDDVLNPERGFYDLVDLTSADEFHDVRLRGHTLAYAGVRLDAFRNKPIGKDFLDRLDKGFGRARAAGLKTILRFAYNDCLCEDAAKERILSHITQVGPILAKNADVIAVLQAGFIGAWGEWHSSVHKLDNPTDEAEILSALLAALPKSRSVQVRTPKAKSNMLGAALTSEEAFTGTDRARAGHHNDCFLASDSDFGTYARPVATWKAFVAEEGNFVPVGGETCAPNPPRSSCPAAMAEMSSLHWSFLNGLYHPDVLESWKEEGCWPQIQRRLGYRISLVEAAFPRAVRPGGLLRLEVRLKNQGYAAPYNARPVYVVLAGGTTRLVAHLAQVDPRRWHGDASFRARLRVPAHLVPGEYRLALWLPDDADTLRDRPEYAVRLANEGTWDPARGENVLTSRIHVDPSAGGAVDPDATSFREIE